VLEYCSGEASAKC